MAVYQYIARSQTGQQVNGTIQADNEAAAVRTLDERSLFPIQVVEQRVGPASARSGRRVKLRELGIFYGQLADLLNAGVPILRALETISRAIGNVNFRRVIRQVTEQVAEGRTLAEAMDEHPAIFTNLHVAMVRAGETAGFLEDVCMNLSEYLDRQDELRSKVRGSIVYPVMLTTVGTLVVLFLLLFVVPQFRKPFQGMPLPLPTRMLFGLSGFLLAHQWIALAGTVMLVAATIGFIRSRGGRALWDRLQLRLPILGSVIRAVCITRFCRILGTMLANGVPILRALKISRAAAGNQRLEEAIARAAEAVEAGDNLAEPLAESGLFPPEVIEMIAIAEESNQLEKVLLQVAETTERRTGRKVDQAVRLIEPLILMVIAAVVGFVAAGLLYPVFTMSRTLG